MEPYWKILLGLLGAVVFFGLLAGFYKLYFKFLLNQALKDPENLGGPDKLIKQWTDKIFNNQESKEKP